MRVSQSLIVSSAEVGNRRNPSSSSSLQSKRTGSERPRTRKKHKRLDTICEKAYNLNRAVEVESNKENAGEASGSVDLGPESLRRSSRVRRAPVVLDASPLPVKKKRRIDDSGVSLSKKNDKSVARKKGEEVLEKPSQLPKFEDSEELGSWRSRLRSRVNNASFVSKEKGPSPHGKRKLFDESDGLREESKATSREMGGKEGGYEGEKSPLANSKRSGSGKSKESPGAERADQSIPLSNGNEDGNERNVEERLLHLDEEDGLILKSAMDGGSERVVADDSSAQIVEKVEGKITSDLQLDEEQSGSRGLEILEQSDQLLEQSEHEQGRNYKDTMVVVGISTGEMDNGGSHAAKDSYHSELGCIPFENENVIKLDKSKHFSTETLDKPRIREGRRCGLCGRGTDGKPPKRLVRDSAESGNETYGGSSSSEEANYDVWDGFGDEPGWLGRLLGPIHNRFGIADVWVHQHCAVWSPEVYFAGLGCLKNVRAALCRGRALKCSRCGRPGATIGCRVDRCPKTYHLPCGRADGCIFDHRKFLIACIDHRHLFQPQGNHYLHRLKKLKAKKMKVEMRKFSHDAWRKDFEAEEKWLENCGEDEEFLKREGKRLHRDIMRIAPTYIGGSSSENKKLYQGWESVAGLQDVIQCMKEVVILPLLYPEFFNSLGLTPPRGVLLHGYPGTGKTLIVRALIGSCARGDKRIAYFARKGADCLGKYVGDAERQLRLLFQVAERSQPSVIFFDEIDGLAPCRTRQQDQTHNSVVSTLLALMDGLKSRGSVMVIGATNRPEAIDPALRRPGRFDREIYFPLPSVEDRAAILALHTQRWPKPVSGSLLKWIARKTVGFAGADLQALCTQAAMIALKRSCALQELMSAIEKKTSNGSRPLLPSFHVEERDWLDAFVHAPPPCSRREAGMAANDVVSSPLHTYFIPCLLQPLSRLVVSLYLDERIWLPPSLYKAAKLIKNVIVSALEKMKMSSDLWWSHLLDLIQEAEVARKIARNLSCTGLLVAPSTFVDSDSLIDDTDDGNATFELCKVNHAGARTSLLRNRSYLSGRTSGFRVLIAGCPKSGQQHLASCLLQGFVGCVEIQKVNLATISQEGHGDVVEGLTHILLKCASMGLCLIYMPRIDLWAMETKHQVDEKESDFSENMCKSANTEQPHDSKKTVSRAWNSFIEQADSMCLPSSLMILATSEVPNLDLPLRISQFFTSDVLNCNDSNPSDHTVPRFLVQIDGNFNYDMVIDSSASELLSGLVQQYVQMIHHRAHTGSMLNEYKFFDATEANPTVELHDTLNSAASDQPELVISGRTTSNGNVSYNGNKIQQNITGVEQCPPILKTFGYQEDGIRQCYPQDPVPISNSNNRNVKGKSSLLLAISTFGYQILRYPHFAELCWATSKLKEGPFTDINGPWKGWPFNACIIHPNNSLEKLAVGCSSGNLKNKEHSGVVRGLIAVGILAYKGLYTSVRDVSFEVRKVLELLVRRVNAKILGGRDRCRFLRLLSQVAYLEDMVNSWAYTLRSLERDSQMPMSNPGPVIARFSDNCHTSEGIPVGSNACNPNISQKSSHEVKVLEHSPWRLTTEDSEGIDSNKGVTHLGLANSEVRVAIFEEPFQQMASFGHSAPGLHFQSSSSAVDPLVGENTLNKQNKTNQTENGISEKHASIAVLGGGFDSSKQSNGLEMKESVLPSGDGVFSHDGSVVMMNSSPRKVSNQCNGLSMAEMGLPSEGGVHNLDKFFGDVSINKNSDVSAASGVTCLYSCCSDCLHEVYVLIRKILIHEREKIESCWTVEDVHDIVASWSVNLLSAVSEFCVAESINNSNFFNGKLSDENKKNCACPDVGHIQLKEASYQCKDSGNRVVVPMECTFHSEAKNVTEKRNACTDSQFGLGLKFLFRDNVLISSDPTKDVLFHCKFEKLCLGSLIWILMIKQPLG